MSDSESSVEVEVKHELQNEAKVRELIQKAKQLLPEYSEESLVSLYRQSYHTQVVFLNKIDVIKRQKNQIEESGEWIESNKRGERQVRHFKQAQNQPIERKERYNFLEDKKLIDRALKFRHNEHRNKSDYYEKQETKKPANYKQKREQGQTSFRAPKGDDKKANNNKSFQQKKLNYKQKVQNGEKVEQKQTSSKIETQLKKNTNHQNKTAKAYQQKPKEFVEKKTPVQQTKQVKEVVPEVVAKKQQKVLIPEPVKAVQTPIIKQQPKKVEVLIPKEEPKKIEAQVPKEEPKKVETPVIKEQPKKIEAPVVKEEPKKVDATAKVEVKQTRKFVQKPVQTKPAEGVSMKLIAEQKKVQQKLATTTESSRLISSTTRLSSEKQLEKLSPAVREEFTNSLNSNSYILKYILPVEGRLQKVSYLRYPDGSVKQVKTRQVLPVKE